MLCNNFDVGMIHSSERLVLAPACEEDCGQLFLMLATISLYVHNAKPTVGNNMRLNFLTQQDTLNSYVSDGSMRDADMNHLNAECLECSPWLATHSCILSSTQRDTCMGMQCMYSPDRRLTFLQNVS